MPRNRDQVDHNLSSSHCQSKYREGRSRVQISEAPTGTITDRRQTPRRDQPAHAPTVALPRQKSHFEVIDFANLPRQASRTQMTEAPRQFAAGTTPVTKGSLQQSRSHGTDSGHHAGPIYGQRSIADGGCWARYTDGGHRDRLATSHVMAEPPATNQGPPNVVAKPSMHRDLRHRPSMPTGLPGTYDYAQQKVPAYGNDHYDIRCDQRANYPPEIMCVPPGNLRDDTWHTG